MISVKKKLNHIDWHKKLIKIHKFMPDGKMISRVKLYFTQIINENEMNMFWHN